MKESVASSRETEEVSTLCMVTLFTFYIEGGTVLVRVLGAEA